MKRLLLVAALLLLPLFAGAQDADNLLVPDGTLYMIRQSDQPLARSEATTYLVLTSRRGDEIHTEPVPATLTSGVHSNPAMAYDSEAGMLYIFWLRHTALLDSELLFASIDSNGVWSDVTAFGKPFDYRENLRIAVTRKVVTEGDKLQPGITVHATWWETDTHTGTESAKYAILGIESGRVTEVSYLDLSEFAQPAEGAESASLTKDELAVLRYPVLQASAKQESVLVTFGDMTTLQLNRVRVYPVRPPAANGRIRIPVGRSEGSVKAPHFDKAANSTVSAVSGDNDRLAFYVRDGEKLHYVLLRNGEWSRSRSITLDDQISAPAAVDAIRRLVNEH
jgi:hypothetical protein